MDEVTRRSFLVAATANALVPVLGRAVAGPSAIQTDEQPGSPEQAIRNERIRRALLSGPTIVTKDATVAELDRSGKLTVLRQGSNEWVCVPGHQDIIGATDMCVDPMGLVWLRDLMARKPKPSNATPGLIYMLNGATQHSYTDPFDTTSPAIPIGPHWMVLWPFDARAAGLSSVMRDAGTMVMFAGTPYAHLHICGSPWEGREYSPERRAIWTMRYE